MACWCRQVMEQAVTLRATVISLVLIHSGIVNGYQLLCDAHTHTMPPALVACWCRQVMEQAVTFRAT